jgi:two-component system chemotaxis response regulator CheB
MTSVLAVRRRIVRVVVVSDHPAVRHTLALMLRSNADLVVTVAPDFAAARERIQRERPDVAIVDIRVRTDTALAFIRSCRVPTIAFCSARDGDAALAAIDAGAVDVIATPLHREAAFAKESLVVLHDAIAAATAAPDVHPRPVGARASRFPLVPPSIAAIAASAQSFRAIEQIVACANATTPGIVVAVAAPLTFLSVWVRRMRAKIAEPGDEVSPGVVLFAPADRHITIHGSAGALYVELMDGPLISRRRPSADVLFSSVAEAAGASAIGVNLLPPNGDGTAGIEEMRRRGALTLATGGSAAEELADAAAIAEILRFEGQR